MKILIIGGSRFVGLRLSLLLEKIKGCEIHILNRTGQAPHCKSAVVYKGDRGNLALTHLARDWDLVFDFACYNQIQAESATQFFGKVSRYIFISTMSVYDFKGNLKESDVAPKDLDLSAEDANANEPGMQYKLQKRRAEAVFAQHAKFPVLSVRFPFILGPDDYRQRLEFHVGRIQRGEEICVPNPAARVSMIHSEDAARFLFWAKDQILVGPLNVSSTKPLSIRDLILHIELVTGRKCVFSHEPSDENQSPYAPPNDFFMDTSLLNNAGFVVRPIADWLPELIGIPDSAPRGTYTH